MTYVLHLTYFIKFNYDILAGSTMTRKVFTDEEIHAWIIASESEKKLEG